MCCTPFEYLLVDVKDYMGDDASDGNLCRAVFALDAAPVESVSAAFDRWCRGVLGRRLAKRLPSLMNLMEEPWMLAQTLREWEERNIRRGREEGIGIGVLRGREEERRLLCNQAARRFGGTTADAIRPLLGSMRDEAELAAVGVLIVDSETGTDLLDGMRRLAKSNGHRA